MVARGRKLESRVSELVEDIAHLPSGGNVAARLEDIGFPSPSNAARGFEELVRRVGTSKETRGELTVLVCELLRAPSPTAALTNFIRYQESSGASAVFLRTITSGKPLREILAAVFGSSQYMSDIIIRNPGFLYWLLEQRTWEADDSVDGLKAIIVADIANFQTLDGKLNGVRRAHRRLLLRIGVADLLGVESVDRTVARLSCLADAVVQVVLELLWQDAPALRSSALEGFAVLALGKLGGDELNYSSDIDLIYVCEDTDGTTVGAFHKLARRLTHALSEVSAEGYLYRTDLRLRPDGDTGPLVNSLTTMRIYYENRGRPWEFQAMLKARGIAGDKHVVEAFLSHIRGLVGNPSLSYSPLETIAVMRSRIRENISPHEQTFNIKLMEGGIRDIEFIVQSLQLVHGPRYPDLRVGNTLEGLKRACVHGLIDDVEHGTLAGAYRFFRLVEHRLQMMHQIKTHTIPNSPDEIRLLARRVSRGPLGEFSSKKFLHELSTHVNKVRLLSDRFFEGKDTPAPSLLLLLPQDHQRAADILSGYGFRNNTQAMSIVQSLAYGSFPNLVDRATRTSFQRLLPKLLAVCATTGDPAGTLVNFAKLAAASRNSSAFYTLLADGDAALELFGRLAGISSVLTKMLAVNIEVLDPLLEDPRRLLEGAPESEVPWPDDISGVRGSSITRLRDALRHARDRRVLAGWVIDTTAKTFPQALSSTLTQTMRHLLANAFRAQLKDLDGVALLALGSYAVAEPGITSDIDLLVVTRGRDTEEVTRCVHAINAVFSPGGLPKLDFRLRGEGANAPLVQDLSFYETYFRTRLASWERIALAKCAFWAGDPEIADAFFRAFGPRLREVADERLRGDLVETRKRIERLVAKDAITLETKRSAGGRYDIEYLCAVGLAQARSDLPLDASTIDRIRLLVSEKIVTKREGDSLIDAFEFYRLIDGLIELQAYRLPNTPEQSRSLARYLDRTLELLGIPVEGNTETALRRAKRTVRACYERVLGY